jgi:DNA-binding MarR family transcriptional regulator
MTASGESESADLAGILISVARKITVRADEDPGFVSLTQLEGLVMRHIDKHPGITPSQLAADVRLKTSNASAALRSLESKGFITREADARDRRAVHIHPTRLAADNLQRLRRVWDSLLSPHLIDPVATTAAVAFLTRLDDSLTS